MQLRPKFCYGLQLHPATFGYLDTLDAKHLDNTRHPLDTLDTLDTLEASTPSTPLLDTSTRTSMVPASTGLDRPRQASTGLDQGLGWATAS